MTQVNVLLAILLAGTAPVVTPSAEAWLTVTALWWYIAAGVIILLSMEGG